MSAAVGSAASRSAAGVASTLAIGLQLALALALIHAYELEGEPLRNVFAVACLGWTFQHALPVRWRLAWFLGVAAAALFAALDATDAAWVLATGGGLVGLCLLPGSRWLRLAAVGAAAAGLALLRAGVVEAPWQRVAWPTLASLFLFRAISFLYDRHHERERPDPGLAAAYFFLPPNACFPVFPVVDFAALRRGYDPAAGSALHQEGIERIVRGLIQLLAYRLVYQLAVLPIESVEDAASAVHHMLTNVFLIVRIMGIFHVSVGMLHLFGFSLPPTTQLPFLSPGFSEFWRRANVYWRDFMVKVFFYPVYFRCKRLGRLPALALATAFTFGAAWFLHSYQWFWFQGDFPLRWQDGVYWSIFGGLVTLNTLWVGARGKVRRSRGRASALAELARAARISGTFAVFAVLWSVWMTPTVEDWNHLFWSTVGDGLAAIPPILLGFGSVGLIGIFWPDPSPASRGYFAGRPGWAELARACQRAPALAAAMAVFLVLIAPGVAGRISPALEGAVWAMAEPDENPYDRERRTEGYYQKLAEIPRLDTPGWSHNVGRPDDWKNWREAGLAQPIDDPRRYGYRPGLQSRFKDVVFSTNSFGLRDREYSLEKPPGVVRIAVLGASVVAGSGVADGEPFEAVVERRLAEEHPELPTVELLNFAAPGYRAVRSLAAIEYQVVHFQPDYVMLATENHAWRDGPKELAGANNNGRAIWPPDALPLVEECIERRQLGPPPKLSEAEREQAEALEALEEPGPPDASDLPGGPQRGRYISLVRCLEPHEDRIIEILARRMVALAKQHGFQLLWAEIPTLGSRKSRVETTHRALLESLGFIHLDASDAYGTHPHARLKVAPWDGHPNAKGHRLIADALYPQLVKELRSEAVARAVSQGG